jgi:hypothetical protein
MTFARSSCCLLLLAATAAMADPPQPPAASLIAGSNDYNDGHATWRPSAVNAKLAKLGVDYRVYESVDDELGYPGAVDYIVVKMKNGKLESDRWEDVPTDYKEPSFKKPELCCGASTGKYIGGYSGRLDVEGRMFVRSAGVAGGPLGLFGVEAPYGEPIGDLDNRSLTLSSKQHVRDALQLMKSETGASLPIEAIMSNMDRKLAQLKGEFTQLKANLSSEGGGWDFFVATTQSPKPEDGHFFPPNSDTSADAYFPREIDTGETLTRIKVDKDRRWALYWQNASAPEDCAVRWMILGSDGTPLHSPPTFFDAEVDVGAAVAAPSPDPCESPEAWAIAALELVGVEVDETHPLELKGKWEHGSFAVWNGESKVGDLIKRK